MESLFDELPRVSDDDEGERGETRKTRRNSLVAALPVVEKIISRKTLLSWQSDASDLVQTVALRLWRWQDKFSDKSDQMSDGEWQSFAARTAYNEINRYHSNNSDRKSVPLEEVGDIPSSKLLEGNSKTEICSLINQLWQEICRLTLRQRRALLLHSQEIVIYLLQAGIKDEDLANILDFTTREWAEIKTRLPLSDAQIGNFYPAKNKSEEGKSKTQSIKKARHEARLKLRRLK